MRAAFLLITVLQIFLRQLNYGPTQDLTSLTNESCPDVEVIDRQVKAYMQRYGMVGAQLAVMKNNALVYAKGYGWADVADSVAMQPGNIMRVASVSKLVTATGIMKLVDMGLVKLSDKVFTPNGPLGREEFTAEICDPRMLEITVEHLLRHEAGFSASKVDPMFCAGVTDGIMAVRRTLGKRLAFAPGTGHEYSNVGYFLLSLIIEKVTKDSYEHWMSVNVLDPMYCSGFRIAGNYLSDRQQGEVHYYMHSGSELKKDYHGDGTMVEGCYGSNNVRGSQGAGAWLSNAAMLCRFVAGIDLDWGIRSILSLDSVMAMTDQPNPESYALGWNDCNEQGVWTRTGSFAGTTAIIKNFSNESECWVLITNTSTWLGPRIAQRSGALINKLRNSIESLPSRDLFYK